MVTKNILIIFLSLRYGLQLCNQVRSKSDDPTNQNMKAAQIAQNKMLRMLGVSLKEHITSISLLQKYKLSSVNQLAGEIKLTEAWKSTHITSYPFKLEVNNPNRHETGRSVRQSTVKLWKDSAKTKVASESFSIDAAKLWNNATDEIKNALTLRGAKREIKKFCKTLEI